MKLRSTLAILALGILLPSVSSAALVAINVNGFSHDIVWGAGEPGSSINGSMDGGGGFAGATWYGIGRNTAAPTTGLPIGPTISASTPDLSFVLQPFAGAANAMMLNGGETKAFTLTLGAAYSRVALVGATGNGVGNNSVTFTFADGGTQIFSNFAGGINSDWFNQSPVTYNAQGRTSDGTAFDNVNNNNPRLYESLFTLNNSSNLLSITVTNNGAGHTAIMAVSGEVIPEPTSAMLLGAAGAIGLMRRRRA